MLPTTDAELRSIDPYRQAWLARSRLIRDVHRPAVDVDRLRQRLGSAFLLHGWFIVQPESTMAVVTRIAAGTSLN
jgi:hypothetical protein